VLFGRMSGIGVSGIKHSCIEHEGHIMKSGSTCDEFQSIACFDLHLSDRDYIMPVLFKNGFTNSSTSSKLTTRGLTPSIK
jgi:hypothetical protein